MKKNFRSVVLSFILVLALIIPTSAAAIDTNQVITFSPSEISSVLNNPYMGWAPWANGGPYQQPHRLVYVNVTWRDLEPTKGNYAFDALEAEYKFNYWAQNGKKIILRINMDYPEPTSHKDIPDWLYNEINGDGTWYDIDWGKGFSPNYNNTKLIAYHKTLINALAARYNNDNRIPIIALGSLGHWGEFHTKKSSAFTIPFPSVTVSDQYVQHYVDSFTNKKLIMRRPFQIAKNNGMGLFNDSFGSSTQTYDYFVNYINNGYTDWLTNDKHPAMPDFWKTAPSGGEFANYPGLSYLQDSTINTSLQMLRDSHTSWLGPCSPGLQPSGTSIQKNFDLMLKTMGYRFVLRTVSHNSEVEAGASMGINMEWLNKGVAPFYYNWPLELSLVDSNGNIVAKTTTTEDIRTWLPGIKNMTHNLNIPSSLSAGTYTLCAAIIDPETGMPGIDLAISGRRADGRYTLSQIKVTKSSPSTVEINGATYIEIPKTGVTYSDYTASIKDQNYVVMPGETVTWSLQNPAAGVSLDPVTGKITLSTSATQGTLTLKATSNTNTTVTATKDLILFTKPDPVVTTIEIKGATYIKIPVSGVTYSDYTATIKDENSNVMSGETVTWSLSENISGVTLNASTGKITVAIGTKPRNVSLRATSNSTSTVIAEKGLIIFVN